MVHHPPTGGLPPFFLPQEIGKKMRRKSLTDAPGLRMIIQNLPIGIETDATDLRLNS